MDVQCDRCKTEYEFDDALVSGRGTTVKCTNCGFQFKVHKQGSEAVDDRWILRTSDHREIVYHALKELQKAILAKQVGRHDTLSRGNAPPRPLGSIAELAPFFEEPRKRQTSTPPVPPPPLPRRPSNPGLESRTGGTQLGMPQRRSDPPPAPRVTTGSNASRPPAPTPPPRRDRMDTLRPPETAAVPPPAPAAQNQVSAPPSPFASTVGADFVPAVTAAAATVALEAPQPQNGARDGRASRPMLNMPDTAQTQPMRPELSSPLPPPTRSVRPSTSSYDEMSDAMRLSMRPEMDSTVPGNRPARRVGGWLIAVVLVLSVGAGGVLVGRKYMPAGTSPVASAPLDPRAQDFLRAGERALDEGDVETAKESFDKASVIAEKDPRVLLDLARLATIRADVPWLKQRLSPQDASEETKRWAELSSKAKTAADVALGAAPEDTAAIRVKMDALRIAGDREAARAYVTRIILNAQQPETAYVLAALDLAEPEPLWKTIIERLRLAAQAEGNSGRARAALVYALARSGDRAGAKAELDKLGQLAHSHPLVSSLKAFVDKTQKVDAGVAALATSASAPQTAPPGVDVSVLPRPGGGGGGGEAPITGDAKSLVAQGTRALGRGDHDRANALFAAALDKNPGDSEAQAGLGDVARAQHNLAGARSSYQKAVRINSHYLPALIGLADVEWEMGDRASAQRRYKEMVDNFPEPALPQHVKDRAHVSAPAPQPVASPDSGGAQ